MDLIKTHRFELKISTKMLKTANSIKQIYYTSAYMIVNCLYFRQNKDSSHIV